MTGVSRIEFGITASSTGLKNGACTFIENSLKQKFAWVACHHRVMELPFTAAFSILFGPAGGLHVAMFRSFQQTWSNIDQATYKVASDDMFDSRTSALREQMVQFCKATLEGLHQRVDYKEFLQLSLIFLDSEKARVSFRAPEAFQHACWMTKVIYSINIYVTSAILSNCQREAGCEGDGDVCESCLYSVLARSTSGHQSTTQ